MTNQRKTLFLLGALMVVIPSLLVAQPSYPDKLNGIVKQLPNSNVLSSATNKYETNAVLTASGTPVGDVFVFYKKAVVKEGWEIENEIEIASTKSIEFRKGDQNFVVTVMDMGEQLMITLAATQ